MLLLSLHFWSKILQRVFPSSHSLAPGTPWPSQMSWDISFTVDIPEPWRSGQLLNIYKNMLTWALKLKLPLIRWNASPLGQSWSGFYNCHINHISCNRKSLNKRPTSSLKQVAQISLDIKIQRCSSQYMEWRSALCNLLTSSCML